jgi:uncharacterized damage-inducible protein DinB
MTTTLLTDAFEHHAWATDRLLESCADLTWDQLTTDAPGTYGPIIATLNHLVQSDRWYLHVLTDGRIAQFPDESRLDLDELREAHAFNAAAWREVLATNPDPDTDIARSGEGWAFHAPWGIRLAQAVHHGTDHRSQVCTALTILGVSPPEIDVWDYGRAVGRTREVTEAT